MKVAVVGCGAMGSIYAALLSDGGNEVLAIARSQAHVAAINSVGLQVEGASGDRTVRIRAFTDIPDEAVDLVIVAVKATQIAEATRQLERLIGLDTLVLTIQNGIGSAEILAERIDANRILVGIAGGFGASVCSPGHIIHNGMNAVRLGAYDGLAYEQVQRIAALWRQAGFNADAVTDVISMQWEKLICNVAYSAPCALTGMTLGEVLADSNIGGVSRAAATEAWTIARALGINIKVENPVELARQFGASMPNAKPSLLQDLENRRPTEIDFINGAVCRGAAKLGLAAPVNATLVAMVKWRERQVCF